MTFVKIGGRFRTEYIYFDIDATQEYVADSLFYKRKLPVKFKDELNREGDKYRVIFCTVPKKRQKDFEDAMEELKNKMALLGHLDYEDYCTEMVDYLTAETA